MCGVVSDQEMIAAKGPNIMGMEERCELARACKWVDEVHLIEGISTPNICGHLFILNFLGYVIL